MRRNSHIRWLSWLVIGSPSFATAGPTGHPTNTTSIFAPASTPAQSIFGLSIFVLATVAIVFIVVGGLLTYSLLKFRERRDGDRSEPPQIYGSSQIELAWTVIPVLIVVALFLSTAHVIASVQNATRLPGSLDVVVIGHQFLVGVSLSQLEGRDGQ